MSQPAQYATRPLGPIKSMIPEKARKMNETKTVREMSLRAFILFIPLLVWCPKVRFCPGLAPDPELPSSKGQ